MQIHNILAILAETYPEANTELKYDTPYQLLVAVILSAQCTDQRVNLITKDLFARYPGPEDFAMLQESTLAAQIRSCGLFRTKSRHIIETSRLLIKDYNGQVPAKRVDLERLPGVGRKTANVVLNVAFNQPTMPVDTHVFRVSRRLGLAAGKTPARVEQELLLLVPPEEVGPLHHRLITHGRRICTARNARCGSCPLTNLCPERGSNNEHRSS